VLLPEPVRVTTFQSIHPDCWERWVNAESPASFTLCSAHLQEAQEAGDIGRAPPSSSASVSSHSPTHFSCPGFCFSPAGGGGGGGNGCGLAPLPFASAEMCCAFFPFLRQLPELELHCHPGPSLCLGILKIWSYPGFILTGLSDSLGGDTSLVALAPAT
jgi:hypothetical protein